MNKTPHEEILYTNVQQKTYSHFIEKICSTLTALKWLYRNRDKQLVSVSLRQSSSLGSCCSTKQTSTSLEFVTHLRYKLIMVGEMSSTMYTAVPSMATYKIILKCFHHCSYKWGIDVDTKNRPRRFPWQWSQQKDLVLKNKLTFDSSEFR